MGIEQALPRTDLGSVHIKAAWCSQYKSLFTHGKNWLDPGLRGRRSPQCLLGLGGVRRPLGEPHASRSGAWPHYLTLRHSGHVPPLKMPLRSRAARPLRHHS